MIPLKLNKKLDFIIGQKPDKILANGEVRCKVHTSNTPSAGTSKKNGVPEAHKDQDQPLHKVIVFHGIALFHHLLLPDNTKQVKAAKPVASSAPQAPKCTHTYTTQFDKPKVQSGIQKNTIYLRNRQFHLFNKNYNCLIVIILIQSLQYSLQEAVLLNMQVR